MTSSSLLEDCQGLIEKGHESWMSYFNKWETVAKYEEDIPEIYLDENSDISIKPVGKKKQKQLTQTKKRKTMSLITIKKNQKNRKKIIKKRQVLSKKADTKLEQYQGNEDKISEMLESNLKTFFKNFVRENKSKVEIFSVLAFSSSQETNISNLVFSHEQTYFQLNKKTITCPNPKMNAHNSLVSPIRSTFNECSRSLNSPLCHLQPAMESRRLQWANNRALVDRYSTFELSNKNMNHPNADFISRINSTGKSSFFSRSPAHGSSELKPLEWDFSHKSPVSVSRKINKEYFIKRTFPKMNITLDGERLRNLCLHKRTNSVSLSMENSNFTTPERKPSERKCFSENVLQRKRRCPSKLFFDNEEDSESDDQTENPRPLIRCRNKEPKTQIITQVLDSDSDEYESIFDRVEQS